MTISCGSSVVTAHRYTSTLASKFIFKFVCMPATIKICHTSQNGSIAYCHLIMNGWIISQVTILRPAKHTCRDTCHYRSSVLLQSRVSKLTTLPHQTPRQSSTSAAVFILRVPELVHIALTTSQTQMFYIRLPHGPHNRAV